MNDRPTLLLLSGGGLKSTVLAARCVAEHHVVFVHVNYGQRSAASEVRALRSLAEHYGASPPLELESPHVLQIQQRLLPSDASRAAVSPTGVVGTNALSPAALRGLFPVLLSIAAQTAWRAGVRRVLTGVSRFADETHLGLPAPEHRGADLREFLLDFTICTETFGGRHPVRVEAPLLDFTVEDFVRTARQMDVPLELTWSCQGAGKTPCGLCSGCATRDRALAAVQHAAATVQ